MDSDYAPSSVQSTVTDFNFLLNSYLMRKQFSDFSTVFRSYTSGPGKVNPSNSVHAADVVLRNLDSNAELDPGKPLAGGRGPVPWLFSDIETLRGQGYMVLEHQSRPRVFTDKHGSVVLALIPCPEVLTRSGFNDALSLGLESGLHLERECHAENASSPADEDSHCISLDFGDPHTQYLKSDSAVGSAMRWQAECVRRWMPKIFQQVKATAARSYTLNSPTPSAKPGLFSIVTLGSRPPLQDFPPHSRLCAFTASGQFDHLRSGHLIFPSEKLAIEFPCTSTCIVADPNFLPSYIARPSQSQGKVFFLTQYSLTDA
ncbi:hypothetical protein BKA70DRAFT_1417333 [Coprinopsis sp. MPI-PUGE-AT-0042]|nr:hypothetical protein BKA70DRAFT_1417333 [Coprinopsis sp. MPI-PUGE-AT-0042]